MEKKLSEFKNEKRKKVILHFLKTGSFSGAESVAITIIDEIQQRYGWRGIYVSPSGKINKILSEHGIEHAIISESSLGEYARIVKEYQPDVIHAHDFFTSMIAANIRSSACVISHLHNNPPWISRMDIRMLVYAFSAMRFKKILGVSDSILNEFKFKKYIKDKTLIVGNPFDKEKIIRLSKMENSNETCDVLFLGRLAEPKNPVRFLNILDLCKKQKSDISALMIGDGDLRMLCEEKISQLGLEDNVQLLGFKDNPYVWLKNTKVLCVPSIWEGFGLVVVEAFSLGIPVVATPVGGMKSLVIDKAGMLSDNNEEMCSEIIRLLSDNSYYIEKSEYAKKRAAELDNINWYIEEISRIYK